LKIALGAANRLEPRVCAVQDGKCRVRMSVEVGRQGDDGGVKGSERQDQRASKGICQSKSVRGGRERGKG